MKKAGHYIFAILVLAAVAWGVQYEEESAECAMSDGAPLINPFTGTCLPAKE